MSSTFVGSIDWTTMRKVLLPMGAQGISEKDLINPYIDPITNMSELEQEAIERVRKACQHYNIRSNQDKITLNLEDILCVLNQLKRLERALISQAECTLRDDSDGRILSAELRSEDQRR